MLEIERRLSLATGADEVWERIGDFGDLSWHPAAKATDLQDSGDFIQRIVTLPDDAVIIEQLDDMDDAGKSYFYSIVESPLPVSAYRSTLIVTPLEEGCEVLWRSQFEADGVDEESAKNAVAGIYEAGFSALAKLFG